MLESSPKKCAQPGDPMQLQGVALDAGDIQHMLDELIDEYVRIGYRERHLIQLFTDPFFQMTYALRQRVGDVEVRRAIRRTLTRWGVPLDGPAAGASRGAAMASAGRSDDTSSGPTKEGA